MNTKLEVWVQEVGEIRLSVENAGRVWLWWVHNKEKCLDHGCEYTKGEAQKAAMEVIK